MLVEHGEVAGLNPYHDRDALSCGLWSPFLWYHSSLLPHENHDITISEPRGSWSFRPGPNHSQPIVEE